MATGESLRQEARKAAEWRGHDMARFVRVSYSVRADGTARTTWRSTCRKCGAFVDVMPNPPANGIDIGGSAVAVGCRGG